MQRLPSKGTFNCLVAKPRFRNDLLDNNVAHELIIYSVHLARPAPNDALNRLGTPAERMEVPADVDTVTYANADLTETINVFKQYGVRLLTPDEISKEMPHYPLEPFPS